MVSVESIKNILVYSVGLPDIDMSVNRDGNIGACCHGMIFGMLVVGYLNTYLL